VSENAYAERLLHLKDERVQFLGLVKRRLLADVYAHCAVFVNCSLHEGQSNAVLEAVSHGCPLVVSDIAANAEMRFDPASYFTAGAACALRERLEAALAEPAKFIPRASEFLEWSDVATRTAAVYQRVLPGLGEKTPQQDAAGERIGRFGPDAIHRPVAFGRPHAPSTTPKHAQKST